jgi:hypothetical protein
MFERKIQIDSMPGACDAMWAKRHGLPTQKRRQADKVGPVHGADTTDDRRTAIACLTLALRPHIMPYVGT